MISIALRFDDPSAVSDHAFERGLIAVLDRYHACATFAVIPQHEGHWISVENQTHLIEAQHAGLIEVAQHGYQHKCLNDVMMPPTEFADVTSDVQCSKIIKGKAALEAVFNRPISGFVPPFNTHDSATVNALEKQGFQYLSADWRQTAPATVKLALLPGTCQIHVLQTAVREAQRRPNTHQTIIAVMHHYDFVEHNPETGKLTLAQFAALLEWLGRQPDVHLSSLAALAAQRTAQSWLKATLRFKAIKRHHWRLAQFLPKHSLLHQPPWRYLRLPQRRAQSLQQAPPRQRQRDDVADAAV